MKIPKGIKKIIPINDLGAGPASALKSKGIVFLNRKVWNNLHPDHRYFILCHEAGHIVRNTSSEDEADEYGFKAYTDSGRSLKESVYALSKVLNFKNPEHHLRLQNQLNRALDYDYQVNGNINAKRKNMNNTALEPYELEEHFLGLGKAAKARRADKHEAKMAKKAGQTEKKLATADLRRAKGQSKVLKAESKLVNAESGNPSGLASLLALGGGDGAPLPEEKNNTMTIIIIAVGVVIVGFLVWKFVIKKPKS